MLTGVYDRFGSKTRLAFQQPNVSFGRVQTLEPACWRSLSVSAQMDERCAGRAEGGVSTGLLRVEFFFAVERGGGQISDAVAHAPGDRRS